MEKTTPQPPGCLTRRTLVDLIDRETCLGKAAVKKVVDRTLELIHEAVVEGRGAEFRNFGSFICQVRRNRIGRNPRDPMENIRIPSQMTVKFRPSKRMRDELHSLDPDCLF